MVGYVMGVEQGPIFCLKFVGSESGAIACAVLLLLYRSCKNVQLDPRSWSLQVSVRKERGRGRSKTWGKKWGREESSFLRAFLPSADRSCYTQRAAFCSLCARRLFPLSSRAAFPLPLFPTPVSFLLYCRGARFTNTQVVPTFEFAVRFHFKIYVMSPAYSVRVTGISGAVS